LIETVESSDKLKVRFLSIDVFRGLAVVLMVIANTLAIYENVPAWSKHAGDFGLTYVDLIAPFFVFMLALNMNISYQKRKEKFGRKKAMFRYIRRFLIFISIGLFLTIYIGPDGFYFRWGTFQVLGMSGLLLLPLIELKPFLKLSVAVIIMLLHQLILFTPLSSIIYESIEGGILGALSWSSIMILSSFLAEALTKGKDKVKSYFLFGGIICVVLGFGFGFIWGISRAYISLPFIIVSVGISSLVYYLLYYIFEVWANNHEFVKKEKFFSVVGKNAFMLYLIHVVIVYSIYQIIPLNISSVIIFSISFVNVAIIWLIAFLMNKVEMFIII